LTFYGNYLVTATRQKILIYNTEKGFQTHNLTGGHAREITVIEVHPDKDRYTLFSGDHDGRIVAWNLLKKTERAELEKHIGRVTCLAAKNDVLVSGGHDKILCVWNLQSSKCIRAIAIYESLEDIMFVSGKRLVCLSQNGECRIFNTKTWKCDKLVQVMRPPDLGIQLLQLRSRDEILACSHRQLVFTVDEKSFEVKGVFQGNQEGDLLCLSVAEDHALVSSGSNDGRVFRLADFGVRLLNGHTDTVLCVSTFSKKGIFWGATGSRDFKSRVWDLSASGVYLPCVAICQGHTDTVCALEFAPNGEWLITGSRDRTIKKFSLIGLKEVKNEAIVLTAVLTAFGHKKEINAVDISIDSHTIASGSNDKTICLWNEKLLQKGTLLGHRRGVWSVKFSAHDKLLASASTDKTIKLWNIKTKTCVRTFEGHGASVLNVRFLNSSCELLSGDADGILKLWTIKTNECENTLETGEKSIWGLDTIDDKKFVTASGVDLRQWEIIKNTAAIELRKKIAKSQTEINGMIRKKKWFEAIELSLSLEQPVRLMEILKRIYTSYPAELDKILPLLPSENILKLLFYLRDWNTNSKHCVVVHWVLERLLRIFNPSEMTKVLKSAQTENSKDGEGGLDRRFLDALISYSQRHLARVEKLLTDVAFMDSLISRFDD